MYTLLTRVIVGLVGPFAFKALCMDSQGDIPAIISQGESQDSQQSAFLHTRSGNLPISRHADTQDRALIKPEEWIVDKIDKLLIRHGLMLGGERVADTILLVDKLGYKELGLKKLLEDAVDTPTRVVVNKKLEELILPESPGNAEKEAVSNLHGMLTSFWRKCPGGSSNCAPPAAPPSGSSVRTALIYRRLLMETGKAADLLDKELRALGVTLSRRRGEPSADTTILITSVLFEDEEKKPGYLLKKLVKFVVEQPKRFDEQLWSLIQQQPDLTPEAKEIAAKRLTTMLRGFADARVVASEPPKMT